MKRSSLFLAAALTAATGVNVVLWSAFVDSSGHASRLHGELMRARASQRRAELDVVILLDQPPANLFERKVFPAPIPESFPSEVPGAA